ncbi:MAG: DUF3987 domain-containing protein [Gemmataceae bacterium]|nr:DUF3987 domain-containing protein [Gemmataceae bacterium]
MTATCVTQSRTAGPLPPAPAGSRERMTKAGLEASAEKPKALRVIPENIPADLKRLAQWVGWCYIGEVDPETGVVDWNKPPVSVATGQHASSTNPATWTDWPTALAAHQRGRFDGLGFVLHRDPQESAPGLVAIDLDKCRDPQTGQIEEWARTVIGTLRSYTEVSPSGRGLRIFLRGKLPPHGRKRGRFEVYETARYVTVTGHHLQGMPLAIEDRQEQLLQIHRNFCGAAPQATDHSPKDSAPPTADDAEIVRRASAAKNGDKFRRLWDGDITGYSSRSEADLALCNHLAFWCGPDQQRIADLLAQSGLSRSKWNREDYRQLTITKALQGRTEFYEWRPADGATSAHNQKQDTLPPPDPINPKVSEWPKPLAEQAYQGLAGEYVRAVEPHTEADPAAILLQLLVGFANAVGPGPHFVVEKDTHQLNEFVILIGKTSKARKGTSFGWVRDALATVDAGWAGGRLLSGLSSGEGVIWAVRDPIFKEIDGETQRVDEGVADKRLLAYEPEFANVLKQVERQGNTLSVILRQGWETGNLRTLTKNSPAVATGAHISLIGHCTIEELRRYLSETEMANGLGNRHLWVCVRRSKSLPEGGKPDPAKLADLEARLQEAFGEARLVGELRRDDEARAVWHRVYEQLSEGKPGLAGAMLGRGEAHVMRLACIYALLDRSSIVRRAHLLAALAVWDYVEESVRFVWGHSLGDPVADELLQLIRGAKDEGVTRTQMRDFFGRNKSAGQIGRALGVLLEHGLAHFKLNQEKGTGRPTERWFAGKAETR